MAGIPIKTAAYHMGVAHAMKTAGLPAALERTVSRLGELDKLPSSLAAIGKRADPALGLYRPMHKLPPAELLERAPAHDYVRGKVDAALRGREVARNMATGFGGSPELGQMWKQKSVGGLAKLMPEAAPESGLREKLLARQSAPGAAGLNIPEGFREELGRLGLVQGQPAPTVLNRLMQKVKGAF